MSAALDAYIAEAERVGARRRHDPAWITNARRRGLERFQSLGFPTTRDEEWRFTSIAPIAERRFVVSDNGAAALDSAKLDPFQLPGTETARLVFVNGRYAASLSRLHRLAPGVRVESLAHALTDGAGPIEAHLTRLAGVDSQAFTALNTAFLTDGAFVWIPASTVLDAPIHLLFVSIGATRPLMSHPRVLVVLGAGSQASIVESYVGLGAEAYLTNAVTEVVAGENTTLHHCRIERETSGGNHIGSLYLHGARDANLVCHSVSVGGSLVRNDVVAVLDGEGGTCTLNGLYLGDGTRLVDNHTTIDHARPHCSSREVYKGILADRARAVFNGKIIVRPDAQKTDAKQTNKALLLSEDAAINSKPQLEIFANDVKCTHGAAVGQMDEEAVFYLRARGLSEPEARHLLVRAFVSDVMNQIPIEPLRARIDDELTRRLPRLSA